jgi:Raf kinase inhibitor-like YbhB/YbcL family protein
MKKTESHDRASVVILLVLLLATMAAVYAFSRLPRIAASSQTPHDSILKGTVMPDLYLKTSAFKPGSEMPPQLTCEGEDLSPSLQWGGAPKGTQSFALIAEDPDAPSGTFTHWVLYDLPASTTEIPQGIPRRDHLGFGGLQGTNDFGKIGYGGPCPPAGNPHRYFFKLYAMDTVLGLKPGAKKQEVERAMEGHVIAQAEIMGKYQRKGKAAA